MVGWIILAVLVLIIVVICLIPFGVVAAYEDKVFTLSAKAAGFTFPVVPREETEEPKPKKEKKPKKKKKKKEKEAEDGEGEEPEKKKGLPLGFTLDELLSLVKDILLRLGRFPRKICVDNFKLHLVAAGKDPYSTAMTYGYINEALSILLPIAGNSFRVRRSDVWTRVDFMADEMEIEAALAISLRVGQVFGLVFSLIFCALAALIKSKRRQRREARAEKKRLKGEPVLSEHTETDDTEKNNQQVEERMDANG